MRSRIHTDEGAASTELGYVFTFLLGVLLLSMFAVWSFEIETSTRERWNLAAIDANLADISAAVERADLASRDGDGIKYAESVEWRYTEADETLFTLVLTDESLDLLHPEIALERSHSLSGTGIGNHTGQITIAGISHVWIIYEDGETRIDTMRPSF